MALDRLTKITGPGVATDTNWVGNNANYAGIVTATKFVGPIEGTITSTDASFTGSVSIGGTLTYEDVTNIDSVGLITARDGIKVGAGITFDTIGDAEFCGIVTFNNRRSSVAAHFPNNEMLVFGNSYLYGNIRNTGAELTFDALNKYRFNCWDGNSMEQWMGVSGVSGSITLGGYLMGTGSARAPRFQIQGSNHLLKMFSSDPSSTTLTERFSLSQSGINFTGLSTHTGNFDLDGDLDVDGHTNLDNVNIVGVTTVAGDILPATTATYNLGTNNAGGIGNGRFNNAYFKTSVWILDSTGGFMLGNSFDTKLYHNGSGTLLDHSGTGSLVLRSNNGINFSCSTTGGETAMQIIKDGGIKLYHNFSGTTSSTLRFETTGQGINVIGHSELDNVNISGVTTVTGNIYADNIFANSGLTLNNNANPAVTITSTSTTGSSRIFFGDPDSALVGRITYEHNGDYMPFYTAYGERLRIGSAGQLGIGGANYGSSGQVLTSGGSGATVSWSTVTGTTINNNADNRVITGSGTANTLNAEQYLTWDGQIFKVNAATNDNPFQLDTGSSNGAHMRFFRNGTQLHFFGCGTGISLGDSEDLSMRSYDNILFSTGNSSTERLRIDSSGNVTISTGNLTIPDSIIHSGDTDTKILFGTNEIDFQAAGGSRLKVTQYATYVQAGHPFAFLATSGASPNMKSGGTNNQNLLFTTGSGNPTRLQIDSSGNIAFNRPNATVGDSQAGNTTATPNRFVFNNDFSNGYTDSSLKLYLFNENATRQGFTSGPVYDLQYHSSGHATNSKHSFFTQNVERLRINSLTNGRYLGRTPLNPAESAEQIKNDISGTPDNDWYYIKQFGNVARLHYCVFKDQNGNDIAGGPWTMNWIAGVHPNQFSTNGSTALGQYLNLCKNIGIDKPGRGMESSRTTSQVYGAWLAVKRALWDLDPGLFNGASSGGGGVLLMPLLNINGEGGSSAHRLVYSTGTSTHIPPNQDGDHCNANQLFCGWWGGNDFSSWATNNNSVPSPEDWGPGDPPHSGDIGARSNSTPQKPSWKDLMLVTCVYK